MEIKYYYKIIKIFIIYENKIIHGYEYMIKHNGKQNLAIRLEHVVLTWWLPTRAVAGRNTRDRSETR